MTDKRLGKFCANEKVYYAMNTEEPVWMQRHSGWRSRRTRTNSHAIPAASSSRKKKCLVVKKHSQLSQTARALSEQSRESTNPSGTKGNRIATQGLSSTKDEQQRCLDRESQSVKHHLRHREKPLTSTASTGWSRASREEEGIQSNPIRSTLTKQSMASNRARGEV